MTIAGWMLLLVLASLVIMAIETVLFAIAVH